MTSIYVSESKRQDKCTTIKDGNEAILIYEKEDGSVNIVKSNDKLVGRPFVIIPARLVVDVGMAIVGIGKEWTSQ